MSLILSSTLKEIQIELVAVLDFDFYTRHSAIINKFSKESGIIIWTLDTKVKRFRKHAGHHLDKNLEQIFKPKTILPIHKWCPTLVLFTRQTDKRVKSYHFIANLISALVQDSKSTIKFSEIDDIMINSLPPKYAHLVPDERNEEWITLLFNAVNHAKILKPSNKGPNIYELQNPAILESPYSRHKILEDLANEMRILK